MIAQLISLFGDRLHQFAVVGMIGKLAPGSSVELLQLAVFSSLPILVFAPLFGSWIDRSNKMVVLVVVDALRGLLVLGVPALFYVMGNMYAFYLPVLVLSLANLLFSPAKSAIIPEVFGSLQLLRVNAILWALGIAGTLAGFVVGGWLFDFRTWQWSFYADGLSYVVSAVFLVPLFALKPEHPPLLKTTSDRGPSPHWYSGITGMIQSMRDGGALIRSDRGIAFCLLVQTALFGTFGVLYVTGVARIQAVFPPEKAMYLSAIASSGTVGLLAGAAAAMALKNRLSPTRTIAHSTLVLASSWFGMALTSTIVPMMAWAFVFGLAVSPLFILTETYLQSDSPVAFRGRVFSAREVLTKTAFLLTSAAATGLAALASHAVIMIAIGVLLAIAVVLLEKKNFLKV